MDRFKNPPNSPKTNSNPCRWLPFIWRRLINKKTKLGKNYALPSTKALQSFKEKAKNGNSITWIGHACFLIKLNGVFILTDPFFSKRASPIRGIGPKRYVKPGLGLNKLPHINFIVISHDHYDHLDDATIKAFPDKDKIRVIVPLGLGNFFKQRGYKLIFELRWHEKRIFGPVTFKALPAIHFSQRSPFTHNKTLWAGFSIESPDKKIYFSGDTAYNSIFTEIGEQYGPFDYGLVPIGGYAPEKILRSHHVNPEQAVQLGRDMGVKQLVAMHWGTVNMSDEPLFEPPERFQAAATEAGYPKKAVWILKIGETRLF